MGGNAEVEKGEDFAGWIQCTSVTCPLRPYLTIEQSLETLFYEASATLKRVLLTYTDSILATATTQSTLAQHAHAAVETVNPQRDQQLLATPIPQLFKAAVPPPVRVQPC